MIINFSVQNFGSIKDKQTLSFEADKDTHLENHYVIQVNENLRLLKLALIYGANASGKTTLLKALNFLRKLVLRPAEKKTDVLDFQPFLFDEKTRNENTILSIEFIQNEIRYNYEIEFNQKAVIKESLYNYNPNKANVFVRKTDMEKQLSEITFGGKVKIDSVQKKTLEANTLWNNSVIGGFLKTNLESKELANVKEWFSEFHMPLIDPDFNIRPITKNIENNLSLKNTVIDILKKADFHISNISIDKDTNELIFEHTIEGIKYTLPFKQESRGTQLFCSYAGYLYLLIDRNSLIPIDELESSLHPDLFEHFLITFLMNSKGSQLIATTHNREILKDRDLFRNDAIWITGRTKSCSTELYSLADFDTSVIRKTSNIYNVYKTGKLGGTPNLGDNYIESNHEEK